MPGRIQDYIFWSSLPLLILRYYRLQVTDGQSGKHVALFYPSLSGNRQPFNTLWQSPRARGYRVYFQNLNWYTVQKTRMWSLLCVDFSAQFKDDLAQVVVGRRNRYTSRLTSSQPGSRDQRAGCSSERHNQHTGQLFLPTLFPKTDCYVSENSTKSPLWLRYPLTPWMYNIIPWSKPPCSTQFKSSCRLLKDLIVEVKV